MNICREIPDLVKIRKKNGTLSEDLSTFCCCRRHAFAIKALLCNTPGFYIVGSECNFIHAMHCSISIVAVLGERTTVLRYTYIYALGNMSTCIYFVFVLFRSYISILICFVCTSVRTIVTELKLNCSK